MPALFGDFLAAASEHIDAAVCFYGDLSDDAAREVIRELDRLVAAMARYAGAFTPDADTDPADAHLDVRARAEADAHQALREAAASLRADAERIGGTGAEPVFPAARHLAAAAAALTAGHDLLQTHFAPGPDGARTGRSRWATVIASEPVSAALLSELADSGRRLAPWVARLSLPGLAGSGLPGSARLAVSAACRWLRIADIATQPGRGDHPPAAAGLKLLRAVPAHTPPPRRRPHAGETVAALCASTQTTAERLRYLAPAVAARAHPAAAPTAACWQRTAHGAAITGHCAELILRSLADRARILGIAPAIPSALRHAADATSAGWAAWRAAAHAFDTITTEKRATLTPVAAEIGDLALWTGRLAHSDPDWTPARGHPPDLRHPADLAFAPAGIPAVLAAVHHAADALAVVAAEDREAVRAAAASRRLFVPARLMPEHHDAPYPYAPAPHPHVDELLATYDNVIRSAIRAGRIIDDLATSLDAPSSLLGPIRAANRREMPRLAHRGNRPGPQPPLVRPGTGQVEQTLRQLHITEPALLARAAVIDDAARDLITEATTKTHRRDTASGPGHHRTTGTPPDPRHPAHLAAKDTPHGPVALPPKDTRPDNPRSNVPSAPPHEMSRMGIAAPQPHRGNNPGL